MWVEDGTQCPLLTCSDTHIQPYDSQATQVVADDCFRICVYSPKQLLNNLKLERGMLLYLTQVKPCIEIPPTVFGVNTSTDHQPPQDIDQTSNDSGKVAVTRFSVYGAVELLPRNTRYHKSLMQRLEKSQAKILPSEQILKEPIQIEPPLQVACLENQEEPTTEPPANNQPTTVQPTMEQPAEELLPSEPPITDKSTEQDSTKGKPTEEKDLVAGQSHHLRLEIEMDDSPQKVKVVDPSPPIVVEASPAEVAQDSGNEFGGQKGSFCCDIAYVSRQILFIFFFRQYYVVGRMLN